MAGNATVRAPASEATSSERRCADARRSSSPSLPPCQTGPTAWITMLAGKSPAVVALASPGSQPPSRLDSSRIAGPPVRWIAPSTPPPPSREVLAALTIASTETFVMSPCLSSMRSVMPPTVLPRDRGDPLELVDHLVERRPRVDLAGGAASEQRLDDGRVVGDQLAIRVGLAVVVAFARGHPLEDHIRRRAQQDDGVEPRIELPLVRDAAGDEQRPVVVLVEERADPVHTVIRYGRRESNPHGRTPRFLRSAARGRFA